MIKTLTKIRKIKMKILSSTTFIRRVIIVLYINELNNPLAFLFCSRLLLIRFNYFLLRVHQKVLTLFMK